MLRLGLGGVLDVGGGLDDGDAAGCVVVLLVVGGGRDRRVDAVGGELGLLPGLPDTCYLLPQVDVLGVLETGLGGGLPGLLVDPRVEDARLVDVHRARLVVGDVLRGTITRLVQLVVVVAGGVVGVGDLSPAVLGAGDVLDELLQVGEVAVVECALLALVLLGLDQLLQGQIEELLLLHLVVVVVVVAIIVDGLVQEALRQVVVVVLHGADTGLD